PVEQVAVEWAIHEPPPRLKVPQRHAYPYTSFDALLRLPLLRLMHTRTGCLSVDRQQQFSKYKSATTTIRRSVHQSRKTFSSEKTNRSKEYEALSFNAAQRDPLGGHWCLRSHSDDGTGRRHDQGGCAALAFRHHGNQRNHAERHRADDDRRTEQGRRSARQKAGAGGGRSRIELAAVRGKNPRADFEGKSFGDLRLLDVRIAQIGIAGHRGIERPAVLPGAIRR